MPSGEQHEISRRDQGAVVVEVGGGLRVYEAAEGALLDGYEVHETCSGGRGQPLIPWPNRVRDGQYEFDGRRQQLSLSEPEAHNAIHGLVRWASWTVAERASDRILMEHVLHPQPGWAGTLQLQIEYALGDRGLAVTTSAVNVGSVACPFGAGAHPYLTLGTELIDSLTLQAPGRRYLESDERGIPTGVRDAQGTPLDYLQPRELAGARLDTAYTDLVRDGDGLARVRIATADGTRRATLWMDGSYPFVMLFTGDTLPAGVRRRGLAVEPMSCAPNALQSGDGLVRLEPGARHTARWGISPD
jgi:aldose 1-epimerase